MTGARPVRAAPRLPSPRPVPALRLRPRRVLPPPGARRRTAREWLALCASGLLHAGLVALLLLLLDARRLPEPVASVEVPVEFETASGEAPPDPTQRGGQVGAPPLPDAPPTPAAPPVAGGPPAPPPIAPPLPAPRFDAAPPMPPPLASRSDVAPPAPAPPPAAPLPPTTAAPAPPAALPPPSSSLPARLPAPPITPPATVAEAEPPPLPPPPPPDPQPRAPAARPAPRPSPFAGTLDLSRGPPITFAQPPLGRPSPRRGTMDLALGAVPEARAPTPSGTGNQRGSASLVSGVDPGRDWLRLLQEWAQANGHYPQQAAREGEDGFNSVRIVVNRDGTVESVQLRTRSGSYWLDAATTGLFRGRKVPAFLPGTPEGSTTVDFGVQYILIRR